MWDHAHMTWEFKGEHTPSKLDYRYIEEPSWLHTEDDPEAMSALLGAVIEDERTVKPTRVSWW